MLKSSVLVTVLMMILCLVSTLIMSVQSQAGECTGCYDQNNGVSNKSQLYIRHMQLLSPDSVVASITF